MLLKIFKYIPATVHPQESTYKTTKNSLNDCLVLCSHVGSRTGFSSGPRIITIIITGSSKLYMNCTSIMLDWDRQMKDRKNMTKTHKLLRRYDERRHFKLSS